ncbi:MAG TPA: tRNA lysidine(34) synthetase TilS [Candidatus Acidoferrales bacterium]|nr:tRNA lysidine(34) synthetase TilS [Candidatus Acidoferrales bacterium]
MLRAGDRVGVAVSGGADSVALLRILHGLRGEIGFTLCALHFNHQLRGAESDADESFVKALAGALNLECIVDREDAGATAEREGWNLEDTGRRLRYGFFESVVMRGMATRVATAHTADDQAETVLTRLLRGTGLTGLCSIYPVRGRIIRPLIEVRREELRNYLRQVKQEWREDATNLDTERLRARVRHRLIPELEKDFSNAAVAKLCEVAQLARDDESFWVALVEDRYETLVSQTTDGVCVKAADLLRPIALTLQAVDEESARRLHALTARLVRRLYGGVKGDKGELSQKHVEQVIHLAAAGKSGQRIELPGRVIAERQADRLIFGGAEEEKGARISKTNRFPVRSYAYEVQLPKSGSAAVSIPELGRAFRLKVIDWPMRERDTIRAGVFLDFERLRAPLMLRNWEPGDAYRPSGRQRVRKLARMLAARRIGAGERAGWPVLTSEGNVVWAARMPAAAKYSAGDATRTGVWIFEEGL